MMEKSKSLLNQINIVLNNIKKEEDSAFLNTISYDYMITNIYAEFEQEIKEIIKNKLKTDNILTNLYLNSIRQFHRGLNIGDITSLLKIFNIKINGKQIEEILGTENLATYNNFLKFRHSITHTCIAERSTLPTIQNIIKSIEIVLNVIKHSFDGL